MIPLTNIEDLLEDFNLHFCRENINKIKINYAVLKAQQELYTFSLETPIYRIFIRKGSYVLEPYIPKQPELTLTRLKKPKQLITKTHNVLTSVIHIEYNPRQLTSDDIERLWFLKNKLPDEKNMNLFHIGRELEIKLSEFRKPRWAG